MSSKVERERRKAQLLSQIQQQRLDLSASRREWLVNFPLAGAIPALSLKFFEDF